MPTRFIALTLFAAAVVLLAHAPDGLAHGVHGAVPPPEGSAYSPPLDAGWWEAIYGRIEHSIGAMLELARDGDGFGPMLSIMLLAFGYGILHAIGPGHGKLLLSSYMTATDAPATLGIAIAIAAAAFQAAIAISVVLIVAVGLEGLANLVPALQSAVNMVSLLLLTALGATIVLRQLVALDWLPQPMARLAPASTCACCGHGPAAHDHAAHNHAGHGTVHHHQSQHHHHQHHDHAADDDERKHVSLSTLGVAGVVFSMGARPCTSAFAILLLALANDLLGLGIAATLAMALGVACTLAVVAVVSVDIRQHAGAALKRVWLPDNAKGLLSLIAGALLTSVALAGLVQAATF
ncbi:MAG: hypothetical protein AAF732_17860 [Pseudomonadota bacterium]